MLCLIKTCVMNISSRHFSLMTIWQRIIIRNTTLPLLRPLLSMQSVLLSRVVDCITQSASYLLPNYPLVPLVWHCTHFSFQILQLLLATRKLQRFLNSHTQNNVSVLLIIILLLLYWLRPGFNFLFNLQWLLLHAHVCLPIISNPVYWHKNYWICCRIQDKKL